MWQIFAGGGEENKNEETLIYFYYYNVDMDTGLTEFNYDAVAMQTHLSNSDIFPIEKIKEATVRKHKEEFPELTKRNITVNEIKLISEDEYKKEVERMRSQ